MKGLFKPVNPQKYKGNPSNIVYRSSWELTLMRRFDRDPNVIEWQSEERAIPYMSPVDGKLHRYFPDFVIKVRKKDASIKVIMIEVKPKYQTVKPNVTNRKSKKTVLNENRTYAVNTAKWNAAKSFCKQRGWKFVIMTEDEIYGTIYKK